MILSPAVKNLSRRQVVFGMLLVALALMVGSLYVAPSLFLKAAIERSGGFYLLPQLTHPTHSDSVVWYVPAAREVADGHLLPSDLHIPANKNLPFFLQPFPLLLFGGLIALTGSANYAYLTALFVFPAITFLAFYWLARLFIGSRLGAIAFGLIGTLTPVAIYYLGRVDERFQLAPLLTLKGFIPWVRTPIPELYLSRITEPLLTLSFLILAFGLLYRFWLEPTVERGARAGAATALLLYTYLHYFALLAGLSLVLFFFSLISAERRLAAERPAPSFARRSLRLARLGPWFALFGIMALGVLPFFLNYLELRRLPQFDDWAARWSGAFEQWRGFRLSAWRDYLLYAVLSVPLIPLRRSNPKLAAFFAAVLIAMVISWNVQIVTGFSIIPAHWRKAFGLPLYTLVAVHLAQAANFITAHPRLRISRRMLAAGLMVLLLMLVVKRTINAARYLEPPPAAITAFSFPREVYESWQWLDKNLPAESVLISTSYVTSLYLTGYTAMNPYLPFAEATLAPRREVEERFLATYRLFEVPPERVRLLLHGKYYKPTACDVPGLCRDEHASRNLLRTPQMLYGATFDTRQVGFDQLTLAYDQFVPLAVIDELVERYRRVRPSWEDFRGAYIYYGPWEEQIHEVNLRTNRRLELIYDKGEIEIYRVKPLAT